MAEQLMLKKRSAISMIIYDSTASTIRLVIIPICVFFVSRSITLLLTHVTFY